MEENNKDLQPEQPTQFVMVVISEENLADYIQANLIERGFVPSQEECDVLGEIFFDYLIDTGVIDEIDIEEE